MHTFEVRFPTRTVLFQTDKFRNRGSLSVGIRQRRVVPVQELGPSGGRGRKTWINLGLVEQVL